MKYRVFLDLEENNIEDFDESLYLYIDSESRLVVTNKVEIESGRYDYSDVIARFPKEHWLYYRKIEDETSQKSNESSWHKFIVFYQTGHTTNVFASGTIFGKNPEELLFANENGKDLGGTYEGWVIVFREDVSGYIIHKINPATDLDALEYACHVMGKFFFEMIKERVNLRNVRNYSANN